MIATRHGPTPWTTQELAALHHLNPAGAKRLQEQLDTFVVRAAAADAATDTPRRPRRRRRRPDQMLDALAARISRLARQMASGDPRVAEHYERLVAEATADADANKPNHGRRTA
ncbi:MAG TPA: hypothetical protein VMW52_06725 [Phycisphaerae bacterium]|nr:hypothetical protein [Phycisphaerae bacterium]